LCGHQTDIQVHFLTVSIYLLSLLLDFDSDSRSILEPAGALAVAGMVKYAQTNAKKDETYVAITSGANMDFSRLRFVAERSDLSEKLMAVTIPETPGSFRKLQSLLHPRNITEFSYRHNETTRAQVIVSLQALAGSTWSEDWAVVHTTLTSSGFEVTDLSGNEIAKSHVRYLAGGHMSTCGLTLQTILGDKSQVTSNNVDHGYVERILRCEFPEHPGALDKFLASMSEYNRNWSCSLFHYRNYGHDFGRVLLGMLIPRDEMSDLDSFLDKLNKTLGIKFYDEGENEAYKLFLK
jgi:threonine dehydratase